MSIQRIYQDLVVEHGSLPAAIIRCARFVMRRVGAQELPFRRMECEPGQELQVDFGQGAWVIENGKRRVPHLFRGGVEPFAQGLQRSGLAADHRELHSVVWKMRFGILAG